MQNKSKTIYYYILIVIKNIFNEKYKDNGFIIPITIDFTCYIPIKYDYLF